MTAQENQQTGALQLKSNVSRFEPGFRIRKRLSQISDNEIFINGCRLLLIVSMFLVGVSSDFARSAVMCQAADREFESSKTGDVGTPTVLTQDDDESSPLASQHTEIIILDDGLSMFAKAGEQSAYEHALNGLERRLKNSSSRDDKRNIILVRMSEVNEDKLREILSSTKKLKDISPLLKQYREAGPSWVDTNVEQALTTCRTMIHKLKGTSLVILSNFSSDNWNPAIELVNQLSADFSSIELVSCAQGTTDNISIAGLETRWKRNVNTAQIEVQFAVRNESTSELDNVIVTIGCDGIDVKHKLLRLRPGETATGVVDIDHVNPRSPHWISVRIPSDSFAPDNVRYAVIVPTRKQRLLMVVDSTADIGSDDALQVVLNILSKKNQKNADSPSERFTFETCHLSDLNQSRLNSTDILCLNNIALTESQFDLIEEYVSRGGYLLYLVGDRVDSGRLSTHGFKKGNGWFPLKPMQRMHGENNQPFHLRLSNYADNSPFTATKQLLETVIVNKYLETASDPKNNKATIHLQLSNGAPLLVSQPYHSGNVMVLLTAAQLEWTNWLWNPSWPVFWEQVFSLCETHQHQRFQTTIGEPLRLTCRRDIRELTYQRSFHDVDNTESVTLEGGMSIQAEKDMSIDVSQIHTYRPGIYEVLLKEGSQNEQREIHAVNIALSEKSFVVRTMDELADLVPSSQVSTIEEWLNNSVKKEHDRSATPKPMYPSYARIVKVDRLKNSFEIGTLVISEVTMELTNSEEKDISTNAKKFMTLNEKLETLTLDSVDIAQVRDIDGATRLEKLTVEQIWDLLIPGQALILLDKDAMAVDQHMQLQIGKLVDSTLIVVKSQ